LRLLVLLAITGCAARVALPTGAPTVSVSGGTIVSMRVVAPAARDPWRAALMADVAGDADDHQAQMEFIVRLADGSMISIVQPSEPAHRTGEHVTVLRGPRTRLAPPD